MSKAIVILEKLNLLLERIIKPLNKIEFEKQLEKRIEKEFLPYVISNQISKEELKDYYQIHYDEKKGNMEIYFRILGRKMWITLFDILTKYGKSVGWWVTEAPDMFTPTKDEIWLHNYPPKQEIIFAPNPHPESDEVELHLPQYLYHSTSISNKDKILKKGIIPYPANQKLSYFLIGYHQVIYVSKDLEKSLLVQKMKGYEDTHVITFRIDTSKLLPHTRFYRDTQTEKSYYTTSRIPPEALTIYEEK